MQVMSLEFSCDTISIIDIIIKLNNRDNNKKIDFDYFLKRLVIDNRNNILFQLLIDVKNRDKKFMINIKIEIEIEI